MPQFWCGFGAVLHQFWTVSGTIRPRFIASIGPVADPWPSFGACIRTDPHGVPFFGVRKLRRTGTRAVGSVSFERDRMVSGNSADRHPGVVSLGALRLSHATPSRSGPVRSDAPASVAPTWTVSRVWTASSDWWTSPVRRWPALPDAGRLSGRAVCQHLRSVTRANPLR